MKISKLTKENSLKYYCNKWYRKISKKGEIKKLKKNLKELKYRKI